MSTPNVVIIVLNWNGKRDTLACLSSLQKIDYSNFSTLVVDNGSTDDSVREIRKTFPAVMLIENGTNLGFAEGNNVGIRRALEMHADYVFLLNNDTIVDPHILTSFMSTFDAIPPAGILGAKIYLHDAPETLDHLGGTWNPRTATFDLIANRAVDDRCSFESPQEVDYVCGAALIARRDVWEKVGLLEKKFFLIWEESDFCFRARSAGFKTYTAPQARVWHKVSASFVGKPHSTYFWWRGRLLWIKRNCTPAQKFKIYSTILLPDILHMYKILLLKSVQLKCLRFFRPHADLSQREKNLLKTRAALQGVRDYFGNRFGNAPSWICGKKLDNCKI